MPSQVSDSYSPPICACGRFKDVHVWPVGTIAAEPGIEGCDGYREVALEETELGKAMDELLASFKETEE